MFALPPSGTAKRWGRIGRLVLAGGNLAVAFWSVTALGSGGLPMNSAPALAGVKAGLLTEPLNGTPVKVQDYALPLLLVGLTVMSVLD
jgi:hypothetical protein